MKALVFKELVIEVAEESFPVHESLLWVDCPIETVAHSWGYTELKGVYKLPEAPLPPPNLKFIGIEFEGVMCSATAEDMWGLNSVEDFVKSGQNVNFNFQNGNLLVLTPLNIEAFREVWVPFRFSFF